MIWALFIPLSSLISILVFWFWFREAPAKYQHLSINKTPYSESIKRKEILRTLYSLVIFALVGGIIDFFEFMGWAKTYGGLSNMGYGYLLISGLIIFGVNDAYFYLSHRFLHWKPIFKQVHFVHHQSHTPNPFSAFSFHPIEGFIQVAFLPLLVLLLPVNVFLLAGFIAFLMLMSVYGHCGYELRPRKAKVFEIFNNAIHHNQHHRFVNYNFGLYLNLWDRLFKTNHPEYKKETDRFKEV